MRKNLNDRQRAYLLAIFETDQTTEAQIRAIPFSPFCDRPKASEWRWMEYSEPIPLINKPASPLYAAIKKASEIDQGTGSTFERARQPRPGPDLLCISGKANTRFG